MPNFIRLKILTIGRTYLIDTHSVAEVRTSVQHAKQQWEDDLVGIEFNNTKIARRATDQDSELPTFAPPPGTERMDAEIQQALGKPDGLPDDRVLAILIDRWLNADEMVSV
jgi:hypothetical protein